jgi:uncharacterized protein YndB with AHSA1/START domain
MTTKIEDTSDREIIISRVVNARRELVWDAMTRPEHVMKWWGPNGFTTTIEEMDVRVGGRWKHIMHGPDGTDYPNESVFTEVVRPERIVYAHSGGRKGGSIISKDFVWLFEEIGKGKTRVTIHQTYSSAADRDKVVREFGAIEGGKQTLARLNYFVGGEPVVIERTFAAAIETVWKALTEPDHMKKWYFPMIEAFKPEVGFETTVIVRHDNKEIPHLWKVTEVVVGKKIAYTWKYADSEGDSLVSWELFPEGKGTRLKLTHAGLESFDPEKSPKYAHGNFLQGWTYITGSLGEYLMPVDDRQFVISREFNAPRELLWKAWTDPKRMAQWWGPKDFTNSVCELDVRVGGAWRTVMRSPEGTEYPCQGVYREIVENEKLVMTLDCSGHPDEWFDQVLPNRDKTEKPSLTMVQTVTFDRSCSVTKLTVRTTLESKEIRDAMVRMGMNEGWSQSLDRLDGVTTPKA